MTGKNRKQAVVLIHGIGEQVPMDTLRGFVDAVWTSDATVSHPHVPPQLWSKPDKISGDFELRRLTTTKNREERRTDFFEMYWAHLMKETKVAHVRAWVRVLLLRWPWRIPPQLRAVWWMLVVLLFLALLAGLNAVFGWVPIAPGILKACSLGWVIISSFLTSFLVNVAGDAARYLHVAPPNIEIRRSIRDAGIQLLEKLHCSNQYDRIILVGHSLGSVIGYDILTYLWPRFHDARSTGNGLPTPALSKLEKLARESRAENIDIHEFQAAQSDYLAELQSHGNKWLVTDFITLGSPLAHASLLMARTKDEFQRKKQEREFPTCPPVLETLRVHRSNEKKFTFEAAPDVWLPHHAAVFAPTRWSNLFFPCRCTFLGDLIGGPLASAFGCGIADIVVETNLRFGLFAHTLYWTSPRATATGDAPTWIQSLRGAVRICLASNVPTASQVS